MTEIEELVTLILPEFKSFIKTENIGENLKKRLDNEENPSIHSVTEENFNA